MDFDLILLDYFFNSQQIKITVISNKHGRCDFAALLRHCLRHFNFLFIKLNYNYLRN